MGEILFKGKRIDSGEYVEGFYISIGKRSYIICEAETECVDGENTDLYATEWYEVDPETVCQYTGLTDKSGRKIFDGDICDRKEKFPEIVTYHDGDWTLDYSYASGKESGYNYCNLGFHVMERGGVEVIGNIFDNPELLREDV